MLHPFFLIFLFSLTICTIPNAIKTRAEKAMIDPAIPYEEFKKYQDLYYTENEKQIYHPLEKTILRPNKKNTTDENELNLIHLRARYLENFADYALCYPQNISDGKCCPSMFPNKRLTTAKNGWTLIDYGKTDTKSIIYKDELNHYAIFRNDIFKKVVITYPATRNGKQGFKEVTTSALIKFNLKKFSSDIKLTGYFGKRAKDIVPLVFSKKNIAKMKLNEEYQIIFVGHSLGAAMAAATCFFALDEGYITRAKNHPLVVTFGQPRTGNEEFALTLMKESELIYRIVNEGDAIEQIPLYQMGYRHTQGKIILSSNKREFKTISKYFFYNVNKIKDQQEMNMVTIAKNLLNIAEKHTYYYGKFIGERCPP